MNKHTISILFILGALICPSFLYAFEGKVVSVSDGDTITVLHDRTQIKVRLYGIDTPEKRQAFGNKAKQFTSDQVFGKTVEVINNPNILFMFTITNLLVHRNYRKN